MQLLIWYDEFSEWQTVRRKLDNYFWLASSERNISRKKQRSTRCGRIFLYIAQWRNNRGALIYTVSQETTLTVAHYNFNPQQPISLIFGTDIAEWTRYRMAICCSISPNWCLCTTWGNVNPVNWVFSIMLSTVSALACYIFDTYQPILNFFFVDSKAVVYFFRLVIFV